MALRSVNEIGTNKTITPDRERAKVNYTIANRRLYNGDLYELKIDPITSEIPALSVNWFRKVAQFYPEFMFSQRPVITIDGNPRATAALAEAAPRIFPRLQQANVDMIRYGQGVIASHPLDPLSFQVFERDHHFEVVDGLGRITHDILVEISGDWEGRFAAGYDQLVNIIVYGVDGSATFRQYDYNQGNLGPVKAVYDIEQRAPIRQVATIDTGPDLRSVYDDIKGSVAQVGRTLSAVAKTLKRNSSPHLYGPDSMLARDETGRATIDTEGMFLPIQQGSQVPGYLTWDSNMDAAQWSYESNMNAIYAQTGLSPVLFSPDIQTGTLTGVALRRTMLPFVTKLDNYARANERTIAHLAAIWNANRGAVGAEVFAFLDSDIDVEWTYEQVFEEVEEEADPRGSRVPADGG